ncbi:hypothetical protein [Clostridium magnum]|uniref:hypothetical protein n=1 Tax=Clostridium magnum TaxID=33954 RepID=UPI000920F827|nr:hypothetical protein [Clostridium magnum]SHJ12607.1 hypothetical protein SAMN02745944_05392 [Clostridium magnum DSM 2767]
MGNKEEFMKYAKRRLKLKEYAKRALECDITSMCIRGMERTSRRKIGQTTRR